MRKEFRNLAPVEEAVEVVESLGSHDVTEDVPLDEANRRVLADRLESPVSVPGFDRSKMDGYAVRAEDTFGASEAEPVVLENVGKVETGGKPDVDVQRGETAEISTGGMMPDSADAVVKVEDTHESGDGVHVRSAVAPADNVMLAGYDVSRGRKIADEGDELTPRVIGVASAAGFETVPVYSRPTVGIVSTGDELVRPGGRLSEGEVYDVNTYTLAAAVDDAGGEPRVYGHVGDDYDEMRRVLSEASDGCDLVLSSGSTSASQEDVLYRVLEDEDEGDLLLHGIAVKPGRPTFVGRLGGTPYVGLPGNPISAVMVFEHLVSRLVSSGRRDADTAEARTAERLRSPEGRTRLLPVGLVESPEGVLAYALDRGSGATTSLQNADGYIVIEATVEHIDAGTEVDVRLFDRGATPASLLGAGERDPVVEYLIDGVVSGGRTRWIESSPDDAVRKVRDGIADIAAVTPTESGGVDTSYAYTVNGFEREVGTVTRDGGDCTRVVATYPGTPTDGYVTKLSANGDARRIELGTADEVVAAVESGRADAGICPRWASGDGLDFRRLGWQATDFLVSRRRNDKDAVSEFIDAVSRTEFDEFEGYRSRS